MTLAPGGSRRNFARVAPSQPHPEVVVTGLLSWILIGLIAGALGKWIMPGQDPGGIIVTILLGIAGAVVGGWIASMLGIGTMGAFSIGGILIATAGALLLLFIYRKMKKV
jgi:uncharacterized membrane protein YeaQ/YmgE (transglycosylase-associated protein family)